jgi:hypothetical protein
VQQQWVFNSPLHLLTTINYDNDYNNRFLRSTTPHHANPNPATLPRCRRKSTTNSNSNNKANSNSHKTKVPAISLNNSMLMEATTKNGVLARRCWQPQEPRQHTKVTSTTSITSTTTIEATASASIDFISAEE